MVGTCTTIGSGIFNSSLPAVAESPGNVRTAIDKLAKYHTRNPEALVQVADTP